MADVDGAYDCVTSTPFGDQTSIFTVSTDGDRFTGTNSGTLGSLDVSDGRVEGNMLIWKMELTKPMKITLNARAVVQGDTLVGSISAGAFGTFSMKGTRTS